MANYFWELGIDWDASVNGANASYMPGGFVAQGVIKRPQVHSGNNNDTITFLIFDLTKVPQVTHIESFTINSQAGVLPGLQSSTDPLSTLQPPVLNPNPPASPPPGPSKYFEGPFPCFQSSPVTVSEVADATEKKFLLNFFVQARGQNGAGPRAFVHDPEMIVGPNGG